MYPAPLRRGLPFLAYGNQLFFRSETVWVLGGQRSTPPGTRIAAYMTSRPDLGERWPSRLVATAAEKRLSFSSKARAVSDENDDDRDERDHDCEHEQNGFHIISHPSEKHGVYSLSLYRAPRWS